jgi:hypothetical protein
MRRRPLARSPLRRSGLTFYEVFLALVLLAGSMALLGQHVSRGVRAAEAARLRTLSEEFAANAINEMLAGIEPLETTDARPLADDDGLWSRAVTVEQREDGLLDVAVRVTHAGVRGEPDEAFTLRQLVRDPAVLIEAQADGELP